MNTTIYLFGKFGHSIIASIDDYTKNYFEEFISIAKAPTQIIIHRYGDIMNYGYVRRIKDDHLFGICVQINGQYISDIHKLFEAFENIVAGIVVRGELLSLNRNGDLEVVISNFLDKPKAVERAINDGQIEFARLSSLCRILPEIDFSTIDQDVSYFKENDHSDTIVQASVKNGYTYIYKEEYYDTLALGSYRSTLSTLSKENELYKAQIREYEGKLKILERKKNRYGLVTLLTVLLFFGGLFLLMNINNVERLEQRNQELVSNNNSQKEYASGLESSLNDKDAEIKLWQDKYNKEVAHRKQLQEELNSKSQQSESLNKVNAGDNNYQSSKKTEELLTYKNTEFGYEIEYPSFLTRQGTSFISKNGNIKLTFMTRVYNPTKTNENIMIDRFGYSIGGRVTYSAPAISQRSNWIVLSGYLSDNSIFYEKSFVVNRKDNNGYDVKLMVTAYSTIASSASDNESKLGNFLANKISSTFKVYQDSAIRLPYTY